MDGIVIAVVTQQGQTVNSSQSAPTIVKLARLDMMTIKAQIFRSRHHPHFTGAKGVLHYFSDPDKRYDATLRTIELAPESVMKDDRSPAPAPPPVPAPRTRRSITTRCWTCPT